MVIRQYEVLWNTTARKQVKRTKKLDVNPERFGLDKYKKNNDGTYRYFEIYRYRIAFRIYKTYIRILRVRSTDQEPLVY